ncbi:uncharacterized protein LOC143854635 [Tasmannia lanceolata]|uniref:uncharacterized protein LOC143854635 n=1 Tax=Tasmannia lanceolata TaxID=3420 RepID=UPI0040638EA4
MLTDALIGKFQAPPWEHQLGSFSQSQLAISASYGIDNNMERELRYEASMREFHLSLQRLVIERRLREASSPPSHVDDDAVDDDEEEADELVTEQIEDMIPGEEPMTDKCLVKEDSMSIEPFLEGSAAKASDQGEIMSTGARDRVYRDNGLL